MIFQMSACLHLQGHHSKQSKKQSRMGLLGVMTPKVESLQSFEISATTRPLTQCHLREEVWHVSNVTVGTSNFTNQNTLTT
jgi:hypothetical protein